MFSSLRTDVSQKGKYDQSGQIQSVTDETGVKILEIRFGEIDNEIPNKEFYEAYNQFQRLKNDFTRAVSGQARGRSHINEKLLRQFEASKIEVELRA